MGHFDLFSVFFLHLLNLKKTEIWDFMNYSNYIGYTLAYDMMKYHRLPYSTIQYPSKPLSTL